MKFETLIFIKAFIKINKNHLYHQKIINVLIARAQDFFMTITIRTIIHHAGIKHIGW
jgi:hypothetical protein